MVKIIHEGERSTNCPTSDAKYNILKQASSYNMIIVNRENNSLQDWNVADTADKNEHTSWQK